MKRQRPEAADDRLALADQSGCVPAQPNDKARALPASDDHLADNAAKLCQLHGHSATAEEANGSATAENRRRCTSREHPRGRLPRLYPLR